jgi:hypothetical protein
MKVTPDGQTLVLRGYIGFELLGQNQYWTRLPDSAYSVLDPSANPQYIHKVAPAPAPTQAQAPRKSGATAPARKSEAPLQLRSTVGQ